MKLLNQTLQGFTATQSTQRGWEQITFTKTITSTYSGVSMGTLTISAGNPEFAFTIWDEQIIINNTNSGYQSITFMKGWTVDTSGNINDNGAQVNTNYLNTGWNNAGGDWSYNNRSTRLLDIRAASNGWSNATIIKNIRVWSERIDLITITPA